MEWSFIALPSLVVGATLLVIFVACCAVVRYYTQPETSHPLSTWVTVLSFACSLLCIVLVPIDILVSGIYVNSGGDVIVKELYYILFGALTTLTFVCIPFTYFYVDEVLSDEEDEDGACCERFAVALRSTLVFLLVMIFLALVGVLLEPREHAAFVADHDFTHWIKLLRGGSGERALSILIACLTVIGLSNLIIYAGYGLLTLPLSLLRGKRGLTESRVVLDQDRALMKQKRWQLQQQLSSSQSSSKKKAQLQKELNKVSKQETMLLRQSQRLEDIRNTYCFKLGTVLAPFRVLVGIVCLLLSLLLLASIAIAGIDRLLNSPCGLSCGFLLDGPVLFNPVDQLLLLLVPVLPLLDSLALSLIACYFFVVTFYGIIRVGVRCLGCQVFKFRRGRTWPQALLGAGFVMMLSILALVMVVLAMAPQYSTWGVQKKDDKPCTFAMTNPQLVSGCRASYVSQFMNHILLGYPLFALVYYFGLWSLVGFAFLSGLYNLCRSKSILGGDITDEDEDDDEADIKELHSLLGHDQKPNGRARDTKLVGGSTKLLGSANDFSADPFSLPDLELLPSLRREKPNSRF